MNHEYMYASRTPWSPSWHHDDTWLTARREADALRIARSNATSNIAPGCCPAIVEFYQNAIRCCVDQLDHLLPPLRPIGGLSYSHFIRQLPLQHDNPSLLMIGSSMAEEVMLTLLCNAWSEGYKVSLHSRRPPKYAATIHGTPHGTSSDEFVPQLDIRFAHFQNEPTLAEVERAVRGSNESYVLLESWFERSVSHGWPVSRILSHAQQMMASIIKVRPGAHLVAMDGNAKHFPGGTWRADGRYPRANSSSGPNASCHDTVPTSQWLPTDWFNAGLLNFTAHHGAGVVHMAPLYRNAGIFHVGHGADVLGRPIKGGRDCLHWCLVPSIIDAWASTVFAAFVNLEQHAAGSSSESLAVQIVADGKNS